MASIRKIRDGITPDLRKKAMAVKDRRPHLQAMGRAAVSLGKRAFTDGSLRPAPWAPRKDDEPHNLLQLSTTLRKSLRVVSVTNSTVTVGSDRAYAATHQLGSTKLNIPARPYLPFKGGKLTARGSQAVSRALAASLKSKGL